MSAAGAGPWPGSCARELIHERAAVAREAARARGKQTGRPRALTPDQVRIARRMRDAGESVSTICTMLKVSRSTLYRTVFNDADQIMQPAGS